LPKGGKNDNYRQPVDIIPILLFVQKGKELKEEYKDVVEINLFFHLQLPQFAQPKNE